MSLPTLYVSNDNQLVLANLTNSATSLFVNTAVVTVTLYDNLPPSVAGGTGVAVTGMPWPATMPYVAASNGEYSVTLQDTLVLVVGTTYYAEISAVGDGLQANWVSAVLAKNRLVKAGALTANQLIRSVRLQLGQDQNYGIQVELSDGQIVHAARMALQEYSRHWPVQSYQNFTAGVGTTVYEPDPKIRGLLEVNMVENLSASISAPEALLLGAGRLAYLGTGWRIEAPLGWASFKQWEKVAGTVFSSNPTYRYLEDRNQLYIQSPIQDVFVSLVGAIDADVAFDEEAAWQISIDPNKDDATVIETSRLDSALAATPQNHHRWVRTLTLAKSKEIVGYIRRKYGSLPGSDSQIQLDGAPMVTEGVLLWDKTVVDMAKSSPHMVPVLF